MREIIIAGFGGQGVLTAGMVLASLAAEQDLNPVWMPAYGPTMRGGKANCVVKYCDRPGQQVGNPAMEEADILIAMSAPSLDYLEYCKPDAVVFVNEDAVLASQVYPSQMQVVSLPCLTVAQGLGNIKGASLVMLGAAIGRCGLFSQPFAQAGMCRYFEGKGKGGFNEANLKVLNAGFALMGGGEG